MLLHRLIGWRHRHHHAGRAFQRIGRKLALDSQQQAKFDRLQMAWRQAQDNLQQIHRERDEMLEAVLATATIDQEQILRMAKIPHLSFNDEAPRVIEVYSDFHNSLNQEQREQLLRLWQKYQQYRHLCRQ